MGQIDSALEALLAATRAVAAAGLFTTAFPWIAEHYRTQRLDGPDLDADGDMLLLQWGVHDHGEGLHAAIDLTRQIMVAAALPTGDPSIWQIRCTFRFPPPLLNKIKNGRLWCLHPQHTTAFRERMEQSETWLRLHGAPPESTVVRLTRV